MGHDASDDDDDDDNNISFSWWLCRHIELQSVSFVSQ